MYKIPTVCAVKPLIESATTFDEAWVDKVLSTCRQLEMVDGLTSQPKLKSRKGKVAWIPEKCTDIYDPIVEAIAWINHRQFRYGVDGLYNKIQFAVYEEGDGFDWHIDRSGSPEEAPRKLSFLILLSNRGDYVGGDLLIKMSSEDQSISMKRGEMIVFDSMVLHKIEPIISGKRMSLSGWACGPSLL
jgi:PKHD-type hydroxylase